jgi:hypothetical protein
VVERVAPDAAEALLGGTACRLYGMNPNWRADGSAAD